MSVVVTNNEEEWDELNEQKVHLLKQLKITLESFMFSNVSSSNSFKWNNLSGLITIFCRNILAIFEHDHLFTTNTSSLNAKSNLQFVLSSPSSMSSSPDIHTVSPPFQSHQTTNSKSTTTHLNQLLINQMNAFNANNQHQQLASSNSSSIHEHAYSSRKSTLNSSENSNTDMVTSLYSTSAISVHQSIWSFVVSVLYNSQSLTHNLDKQQSQIQVRDSYYNQQQESKVENSARRDFKLVYNQLIQQQQQQETQSYDLILLEWINNSLRQRSFHNQLNYLLSEENSNEISKFYKQSSFLFDRSFVHDLLIYVKAFEQNEYKLLRNVKCKLFQCVKSTKSTSNSTNNLANDSLLNSSISTSAFNNKPTTTTTTTMTTTNNGKLIGSNLTINSCSSSSYNQDSLLELKINELVNSNSAKSSKQHRRMHSFPNIQINPAKKQQSTMMMSASSQSKSDINEMSVSQVEQELAEPFREFSLPKFVLNDKQISEVDDLIHADKQVKQEEENKNESEKKVQQSNPNESSPSLLVDEEEEMKENDYSKRTNVFDFIHAVQINCDCNTLDQENSHFIMADLAIASIELIKTSDAIKTQQQEQQQKQELKEERKKEKVMQIKSNERSNVLPILKVPELEHRNANISPLSFDDNSISFGSMPQLDNSTPRDSTNIKAPTELFLMETDAQLSTSIITTSTTARDDQEQESFISKVPLDFQTEHELMSNQTFNDEESKENESRSVDLSSSFSYFGNLNQQKDLADTKSVQTTKDEEEKEEEEQTRHGEKANELEKKPIVNEDGFEMVVDNKQKINDMLLSQKKLRKYSWEKLDDMNNAEYLANRLIQNALNKHAAKSSLVVEPKCLMPTLDKFEFFIKYLEYLEFMQTYYELRLSGYFKFLAAQMSKSNELSNPLCIPKASGDESSASLLSSNLSASSIFLSHQSTTSASSTSTNTTTTTTTTTTHTRKLFDTKNQSKLKHQATLKALNVNNTFNKVYLAAIAAMTVVRLKGDQQREQQQDKYADVNKQYLMKQLSTSSFLNNTDLMNSMSSSFTTNGTIATSSSFSPTGSLSNAHKLSNFSQRIIGDELWAPVREQLILHITPRLKRLEQMQQQHFRCADCGIQVKKEKIKTFSYCEYFSKYFCRCCHVNNQSYIPAYLILQSDYRNTYEVSKKAKNFLEKIYNEPLITLESLNPSLFERNALFAKVKKTRLKLYNSRSYVNSCRFAINIKADLYNQFDDFIINTTDVYSIETIFKLKKTNYFDALKSIVDRIVEHIRKCELCSQLGYICGLCTKTDLLYPFDLENVEKCPNCLSCYHRACFKSPEQCPRCKRKRERITQSLSVGKPLGSQMN